MLEWRKREKKGSVRILKEWRIENLTKTYGEKVLFDHISFMIHEKDRIGLIGVNGTGKSNLLKLLANHDLIESGDIFGSEDDQIGYLSQTTEFPEDLTIAESIFSGENAMLQAVKNYELALVRLAENGEDPQVQANYAKAEERMNKENAWDADVHAKMILQQLDLPDMGRRIKELSGGQKKRVGLAQVLIQEPDLLLLDEPTNHLDYAAIKWLESYLKQYRGAVMLVTHDRYFLDQVTNRIFELSFGKLHEYVGNYEQYLVARAEREEIEKQQEYKRKQLYKQELAWMRAGVQARGTKQQARQDRFHELKDNLNQVQENGKIDLSLHHQRLGKKVFVLEDACYQIDGQKMLDHLNLIIQPRDRIGITGKNGAGKSTFLNILAQKIPLDSGVLEIGETVKIAYYTQYNEPMDENMRMIQYLQETAEEVKQADGSVISVTEMLERFLFPRHTHGTLVRKLSGGEKRRLFLLKLLLSAPNVLLLDEPTNDLDIETLTILEDYIRDFNGAVIAVSHDRYFLDKTMEKLLVFQGNAQIDTYYGAISDYLDHQEQPRKEKKTVSKEKQEKSRQEPKEKTKLSYMEQKEWTTIEEELETLEEKIRLVDEEMITHGADFAKLQELQQEKESLEQELEEKYERWEYLSQYAD